MNVLVVDDSSDNLGLVKLYLKPPQFIVVAESSGEAGIRAYKSQKFDISFIDLQMPQMSGIDVVKDLRKWEKESGQAAGALVAFTGLIDDETKEGVVKAGFDGLVEKPFRKADIISAIEKFKKS